MLGTYHEAITSWKPPKNPGGPRGGGGAKPGGPGGPRGGGGPQPPGGPGSPPGGPSGPPGGPGGPPGLILYYISFALVD